MSPVPPLDPDEAMQAADAARVGSYFCSSLMFPLGMAVFGGMARVLKSGVKTWRQFLASLVVSGFSGLIVHLLMQDADLSSSFKAAMVGLSGYSGGAILDALSGRMLKTVDNLPGGVPWNGEGRRGGTGKSGGQNV